MDRRAPPARDRRGGTGDPLPSVTRMQHCRASVSGRAHGDRPDRAAGRPGDLRGGEDSAGQGLREPARGGGGGGAGGESLIWRGHACNPLTATTRMSPFSFKKKKNKNVT